MFLNDVWNAIARIAKSFTDMLQQPATRSIGPVDPPRSPAAVPSSTSVETPYTAVPPQPSPGTSQYGTPLTTDLDMLLTPLPPVKESELRSATRQLSFPDTPTPTAPWLPVSTENLVRPPMPGCSPYVLHKPSVDDNDNCSFDTTKVCNDDHIKCETEELIFDGASEFDTHPFVALEDVKVEPMEFVKVENLQLEDLPQIKVEPGEAVEMELELVNGMSSSQTELIDVNIEASEISSMDLAKDSIDLQQPEVAPDVVMERAGDPVEPDVATPSSGSTSSKTEARTALLEAILSAVKSLRDRNGSSAQAIKRYLSRQTSSTKDTSLFNVCLKKLVADGSLIQTKGTGARGSFKLAIEVTAGKRVSDNKCSDNKSKARAKNVPVKKIVPAKVLKSTKRAKIAKDSVDNSINTSARTRASKLSINESTLSMDNSMNTSRRSSRRLNDSRRSLDNTLDTSVQTRGTSQKLNDSCPLENSMHTPVQTRSSRRKLNESGLTIDTSMNTSIQDKSRAKKTDVKTLTKAAKNASKGNKKSNKLNIEQSHKKVFIPYSTWHQIHSAKWNKK
ncbi:unnamed protein product [Meganyctiphanes norvegica]|uniref:H15 domain-containing protein n=1 Tax=Meganyctiphanes norvegica TaxID=48144 RepID=A0AAV2RIG2_MEGNR